MGDRKQDVWFVQTVITNGSGREIFNRRGVIELPRPMEEFEAADYALRCEVREALRENSSAITDGTKVVSSIYGRTEIDPVRRLRCTAVARYDEAMDVFQRLMPWVSEGHWEEVQAQEGARITLIPLDWT